MESRKDEIRRILRRIGGQIRLFRRRKTRAYTMLTNDEAVEILLLWRAEYRSELSGIHSTG